MFISAQTKPIQKLPDITTIEQGVLKLDANVLHCTSETLKSFLEVQRSTILPALLKISKANTRHEN